MKIQISDLISRRERKKNISYNFVIEPFYFEGDKIKPTKEVEVLGEVTTDDEIVVMQASVKTELELRCSRCLETFIYPIDIDIEERFTNNAEINENDEALFVKDDVLDITEIVENAIISTLPIKRLCSENCKGLCQSCGANQNKEACNCDNEDIDLRLAGLKALLNNKEV
ncbi:YceD family protein [Clostridium paraputrificum]|uniref:YceD family protein n=1 Tax=Clostridium TaxID=1485 RepID=UPI003D359244